MNPLVEKIIVTKTTVTERIIVGGKYVFVRKVSDKEVMVRSTK